MEVVLHFRLLHIKPSVCLGCSRASHDKQWALGRREWCYMLYQLRILTTEDTSAGSKIIMAINLFFMDRLKKHFLKPIQ